MLRRRLGGVLKLRAGCPRSGPSLTGANLWIFAICNRVACRYNGGAMTIRWRIMRERPNYCDPAERIMNECRLRRTKSRIAILRILLDSKTPLTHEEIHEQMLHTGIDRVTVYRSLQSFWEAGIVHRVEAGDRVWRFAVCSCHSRSHCHPHFTCRLCGRVECLFELTMPSIEESVSGYQIEEQEVYWRGICGQCASKSDRTIKKSIDQSSPKNHADV